MLLFSIILNMFLWKCSFIKIARFWFPWEHTLCSFFFFLSFGQVAPSSTVSFLSWLSLAALSVFGSCLVSLARPVWAVTLTLIELYSSCNGHDVVQLNKTVQNQINSFTVQLRSINTSNKLCPVPCTRNLLQEHNVF